MDILVYEQILGEEFNKNTPKSLIKEAKLIISSLVDDLNEYFPSSKISFLTNKKYKNILKNYTVYTRDYKKNVADNISLYKNMFDNVIILAPEKNLNLYNIVKELENRNIKLLNCSSSFINIATNKISFYENIKNLPDNKINTYLDYNDINSQHPIIAKKIDGIGAEESYIFKNKKDICDNFHLLTSSHFFQEYISGAVIGLNIVSNNNKFNIISINEQNYKIFSKRSLKLDSIHMGKYNYLHNKFQNLINNLMENFIGYNGFFGIDAILTNSNEIFFLEINPRLTTSYVGLKETIGFNPLNFLYNKKLKFDINNNSYVLIKINNE
ncbi:MAG: ATP-grasp domain-containing protein [Gammaproteobacteria bacterium]|tara:strand:+ start:90 stop:1067 length:978 start_codon:yes stop_codon:yes gene_type:complete